MWYTCKQWWNWVWRQLWYRLLELEEDTYAETRSGTEGHIWWKWWPWPQVSWRPGPGHWTVHTPAETAEKCSGSPGSWEWNATDVLDALECSGMHKRSDLMGQGPFGFIWMNLTLFGALGFAPMWSECFCWILHCINAYHCAFEWLVVEEVRSNLCAFPGAPLVRDGHRWGLFSHQRLVEHLYLQHLLH